MSVVAVVPCMYDDNLSAVALKRNLLTFCDDVILTNTPGLGPAYLEAWKRIDPTATVLHVDVGSHSIPSARAVLAASQRADLVVGSRFMAGGEHVGNRWRSRTSRFASAACGFATFHNLTDWTSGLRAYSPKARTQLANYPFTTTGHAWQIEAVWACLYFGLGITEVPIQYRAGRSSLDRKRVMEAAALWYRMVWSSPTSPVSCVP